MVLGQTFGGLDRGYPGILDDFIEQIEQQENNQAKKHIPKKTAPLPPGNAFMVSSPVEIHLCLRDNHQLNLCI
jgi:hypothetical protein